MNRFDSFVEKAREVYGKSFSYESVEDAQKVRVTCGTCGYEKVVRRGDHISGRSLKTCPACKKELQAKERYKDFIERATKVHSGEYKYEMEGTLTSLHDEVEFICPTHGTVRTQAQVHLKSKCGKCYRETQKANPSRPALSFDDVKERIEQKHGHIRVIEGTMDRGESSTDIRVDVECCRHKTPHRYTANYYSAIRSDVGCCRICDKSPYDDASFALIGDEVHDCKYDYSAVEFVSSRTKVTVICPEHGRFELTPNSHLSQRTGCPDCTRMYGNRGWYSFSKLNPLAFYDPAILYHVHIEYRGDVFEKIGITTRSVEERFKLTVADGAKVDIIDEVHTYLFRAMLVEDLIKKEVPLLELGELSHIRNGNIGWTECFRHTEGFSLRDHCHWLTPSES